MKKTIKTTILLGLVIIILSACSTARFLPVDTSNNAKTLKNIEDKAIVYILRTSAFGGAVGLRVDLKNIELAKFFPKNFYLCVLEPGEYVFTGHGENTDEITVNLEKGKKYYIDVIPQMGLIIARCKIQQMDPVKGEDKLQSCKLIGLNQEAQQLLNYTPVLK
jgi:hypothetical protein